MHALVWHGAKVAAAWYMRKYGPSLPRLKLGGWFGRRQNDIERYCRELGWSIDRRKGPVHWVFDDKRRVPPGWLLVVHEAGSSGVHFRCHCPAAFPPDEVPEAVMRMLLGRRHKLAGADWDRNGLDDGRVFFTLTYDAPMAALGPARFAMICEALSQEVAEFEAVLGEEGCS